ncbi:unnamed protein product, partial [Effrenium voratum]
MADFVPVANDWCEEMGASVIEEIMEDLEGFVEALDMPEEQKQTLMKRGRVSLSNLQQRG